MDGEWRPRKRRANCAGPKERRAPSHVKTQARDSGFKKLLAIRTRVCCGLAASNVAERLGEYNRHVTSFAESAGEEMLARMDAHKKLAQLVSEEFELADRAFVAAGAPPDCLHHARSLFPLDGCRRATAADRERLVDLKKRSEERGAAEMARVAHESGGVRVEWDED